MSPRLIDNNQLLAREMELIEAALQIMEVDGTAGLTMDKVVAKVPYSKGTVYNHFSSREDLLTGVCNSGMSVLADLFSRAITFDGSTRERMLAILYAYLLHALLQPTQFMLVVSAKTAAMIERTSERRQTEHYQLEGRLMGPMLNLVDEAIEKGELVLPKHMSRQQIVFTHWAGSFGAIALLINSEGKCSGRNGLAFQIEVFNHANLLLDGMQWYPLSHETDYSESVRRIAHEIFLEESAQVGNPQGEL
ncbi:TetR/AcrR family transcriptional regulator [Sedimenticola selenatireducens]|uniref:TetR/AcrR family transcriptional regulator n=1 Tax=Sedimenticola selenatireducens TaxID=191960 RepID=A0A557SCS5_9GAMM|nr:TetR/AcrR family transcriptional regulator [Sedimenticola selenatireducens]TVO75207.1 TetR/AcrR family transcriptional regulator [Sedimenticola selenatireducens]TVT66939.1 MAG: TetR/AcrR family transcriptional regulator [Sedimenticola selenatireducens]